MGIQTNINDIFSNVAMSNELSIEWTIFINSENLAKEKAAVRNGYL